MCASSYVGDGQRIAPWRNPYPYDPYKIDPNIWPKPVPDYDDIVKKIPELNRMLRYKVKGQFSEWTYEQCEAYIELMEKAHKFDVVNQEPKCADPEKIKSLDKVIERLETLGLEQPKINARRCLQLIERIQILQEELK